MINSVVLILRAPDKLNGGLLLCPLIPLWLVSYMACFDALFVVWVSPISRQRSVTDVFKHPWLLNALCWLVPVAVIVAGSVLTANLWRSSTAVLNDVTEISLVLQDASAAYAAGASLSMAPLFAIKNAATYARHE